MSVHAVIRAPLVALAALVAPLASTIPTAPVALHPVTFRHEGILGTSLDLTFVTASSADAERAEAVALAEIERLRRVISTWDPTSEVSQLRHDGALRHASPELRDVLRLYGEWGARTGGAYTARVGELTALWRAAAEAQRLPDDAALARTAAALRAPAWTIDGQAVTLLGRPAIDLNSLGKGYILDAVVRTVRHDVPAVRGGMVNIGGDIRVWGAAPEGAATWHVAVADPRRSADNAPPLTRLDVGDASVSTSGGYARGYDIGGRHYSHILDARTGRPAGAVAGATVIARDNATANALATSLTILTPAEGLALIAATPGTEALIVTAAGEVLRSPGFARHEVAAAAPRAPGAIQATLAIDVTPQSWNRHRPYVAVWVADTTGKHLRTLAMWGDRPKYLREMSRWWSYASSDPALVDAVARATRPAGKYTLEWDGLDQNGAEVPAGSYQFWLEVAFEDGAHSSRSVVVACGATPASGTIAAADAFTGARVDCAVAKK